MSGRVSRNFNMIERSLGKWHWCYDAFNMFSYFVSCANLRVAPTVLKLDFNSSLSNNEQLFLLRTWDLLSKYKIGLPI